MYDEYNYPHYEEDEWYDRIERFADPGGNSALYPATKDNPRNLSCPTCHWPNRLTPSDVAAHYQCDSCANAMEQGRDIYYYDEWEADNEDDSEDQF